MTKFDKFSLRNRIKTAGLRQYQDTGTSRILFIVLKTKFQDLNLRWLWFALKPLISYLGKKSQFIGINQAKKLEKHIVTLSATKQVVDFVGVDLSAKLRDKLKDLFDAEEIIEHHDFRHQVIGEGRLIIIDPVYASEILVKKSILWVAHLALKMRISKTKLWTFPIDPCDLKYLTRYSILVALAGGANICQSNTKSQMEKYGLPHAIGPYVWTISTPMDSNDLYFSNETSRKSELALLANSGDDRRVQLATKLSLIFVNNFKFQVVLTDHQYSWGEYVELVKNSLVLTTTSFLQPCHTKNRWMFGDSVPKTTLTSRVLEGFVAASAVVTTRDACLEEMGFESGIDFIEIKNFENPKPELLDYDPADFRKIGISGQRKLEQVLKKQLVAYS